MVATIQEDHNVAAFRKSLGDLRDQSLEWMNFGIRTSLEILVNGMASSECQTMDRPKSMMKDTRK